MLPERIEKLKQEYTGKYVVIDTERPEFARLREVVGRVRTINYNGKALVEFDGSDRTWHDLELDYLKVVDKSGPNGDKEKSETASVKAPEVEPEQTAATAPTQKLSRLELARLQKSVSESEKEGNEKEAD